MKEFIALALMILIACVACRTVLGKLGQPTVLGDVCAGVVLGGTVLGFYYPFFWSVIPANALTLLKMLGEFGLVFILVEAAWEISLKNKLEISETYIMLFSGAGIAVSFIAGGVLAFYSRFDIGPISNLAGYIVFCGIAFSVTALPVLMAIVKESNGLQARCGRLAVTAAVYTDIFAWLALAFLLIVVRHDEVGNLANVMLLAAYTATMLLLIKPFLRKLKAKPTSKSSGVGLFVFFIVSAVTTDILGFHFSIGIVLAACVAVEMEGAKNVWDRWIGGIGQLLISLFFVNVGLQFSLNGLAELKVWLWVLIFLSGAVISKALSSYFAGRIIGLGQRASIELGILMSTKGAAELIVIAVGYQAGLLSENSYNVLMLVTFFSTILTAPFISISNRFFERKLSFDRL
ncbi:cation:proton antiporter [Pseudomonas sp. KU43P]|uniref:cation:proton antiporter n=1 Tax=Pseudomonas sp. KU43P TaxID=2487887 RepID=UPI0012AA6324|nr:cation:proton antiporter [Pseudomonas sp. KU43P]BBH45425.1 sodium/hydrogen exchanger family protein [Pseudomonas sp. KU43P]